MSWKWGDPRPVSHAPSWYEPLDDDEEPEENILGEDEDDEDLPDDPFEFDEDDPMLNDEKYEDLEQEEDQG